MADKGHHQTSGSGDYYTSAPAKDPSAPGGKFISTGDRGGHVTHVYDRDGQCVKTSVTGTGGPAKGVPAGGKGDGGGSGGSGK